MARPTHPPRSQALPQGLPVRDLHRSQHAALPTIPSPKACYVTLPGLNPPQIDKELMEAGKRASDHVNLHRLAQKWEDIQSKWIAVNLGDGGSDGVLYDSKRDAVKHQRHEQLCAYVAFKNLVAGSTPLDMAIFIKFTRDAYKAGFRLPDPDDQFGGKDVAPTSGQIDYYRGRPQRQSR